MAKFYATPPGFSRFSYLDKPDDFKGTKKYKTKLILPDDVAQPMIDELTVIAEAYRDSLAAEAKTPAQKKAINKYRIKIPVEADTNKEGEELPFQVFSFAQNAVINMPDGSEKNVKPSVVDAALNPIPAPFIPGGSTIIVVYSVRTYVNAAAETIGVTLDLAQVQLIRKSNRAGGGSPGAGLLTAVEGGYRHDDIEDAPAASDTEGEVF